MGTDSLLKGFDALVHLAALLGRKMAREVQPRWKGGIGNRDGMNDAQVDASLGGRLVCVAEHTL
jgi:hypothetical protein